VSLALRLSQSDRTESRHWAKPLRL